MVIWKASMKFHEEEWDVLSVSRHFKQKFKAKCPDCGTQETHWPDLEVHVTPEHELLGIMLMDGKIRETETDEMGEEPILQDNLEFDDKMKRENEAIESDEKSDTQKDG